MKDSKM